MYVSRQSVLLVAAGATGGVPPIVAQLPARIFCLDKCPDYCYLTRETNQQQRANPQTSQLDRTLRSCLHSCPLEYLQYEMEYRYAANSQLIRIRQQPKIEKGCARWESVLVISTLEDILAIIEYLATEINIT
jgi:hypothetical protein